MKPKGKAKQVEAPPTEPKREKTVRVYLDVPEALHRAVKVEAAKEGVTLKAYLERLFKPIGG